MTNSLTPELTARQARVLEIRNGEPKLSWAQIAERLGVPKTTASNAYYAAMRKVKMFGNDLGTRTPLDEGLLKPLGDEALERQFAKFVKKLKGGFNTDVLLGLLETGIFKGAWRLANDESVWERLTGKDLSLLLGHLIETRQLLRGEPTKIISVEDRRGYAELMKVFIAEADRRGIVVEGQFSAIQPNVPLAAE